MKPWTDEQLTTLALPAPAEIEAARLAWRRMVKPPLDELLEALPDDIDEATANTLSVPNSAVRGTQG